MGEFAYSDMEILKCDDIGVLRQSVLSARSSCRALKSDVTQLLAERDALREDKAILDWLQNMDDAVYCNSEWGGETRTWHIDGGHNCHYNTNGYDLRKVVKTAHKRRYGHAIDDAMGGK